MKILHLDSSAAGGNSFSKRFSAELVAKLKQEHGDATVIYRDLVAEPLPHIDEAKLAVLFVPDDKRTPEQAKAMAQSDQAVKELKEADIVVIGSPMYNFSISSQLKCWIDHVVLPGKTFAYGEQGPKGTLTPGKKGYIVVARGGVYSDGPMKALEHQDSYLRGVLGFIGLTNIEVVPVEGVSMGPEAQAKATATAEAAINKAA